MTEAAPEQRASDAVTGANAGAAASGTPRPRRGRARGLWLLALLVLVLAAAATASYWWPALAPLLPSGASQNEQAAALDARLAAIESRLDRLQSLSDRIGALERRPVPDPNAAVAPLQDRLQQTNQRLDAIEARLSQVIKDETLRGDSAQRVLIVALADLGNAIASSQPFSAQLASVEALGRGRAGWTDKLRPLEDEARTGLPSTALLAQRFGDEVAPAILRADAAAPNPDAGWGAAILSKLRALVIIRRTDGTSSDNPVEAAVATADAALAKADLAGAVAALERLNGAANAAAADWLQIARQRLAAEQTVANLTQEIAADLAASANGG